MDGSTVISNVVALHVDQLREIIEEALKLGRLEDDIKEGRTSPFITQNQAYIIYGEENVKRWLEQGLIKRYRDYGESIKGNTPYRYSVMELIKVSLSSNLIKDLSYKAKAEYRKAIPLTNYMK